MSAEVMLTEALWAHTLENTQNPRA